MNKLYNKMKTARTACFLKRLYPANCQIMTWQFILLSFSLRLIMLVVALRKIINVISRVHHLGHLAHRFRYVDKTFKVCCQFFNGRVIFVRKGVECLLRTRWLKEGGVWTVGCCSTVQLFCILCCRVKGVVIFEFDNVHFGPPDIAWLSDNLQAALSQQWFDTLVSRFEARHCWWGECFEHWKWGMGSPTSRSRLTVIDQASVPYFTQVIVWITPAIKGNDIAN